MICEMCGKDAEMTYRVELEGSVLRLCEECKRFGRTLDPLISPAVEAPSSRPYAGSASSPSRPRSFEERDLYRELPDLELAPDWGKRIRIARESRSWTPEELAKRLNEKKSLVLKLEAGTFRPPDTTVQKVETLLKIRLRADPSEAT